MTAYDPPYRVEIRHLYGKLSFSFVRIYLAFGRFFYDSTLMIQSMLQFTVRTYLFDVWCFGRNHFYRLSQLSLGWNLMCHYSSIDI